MLDDCNNARDSYISPQVKQIVFQVIWKRYPCSKSSSIRAGVDVCRVHAAEEKDTSEVTPYIKAIAQTF